MIGLIALPNNHYFWERKYILGGGNLLFSGEKIFSKSEIFFRSLHNVLFLGCLVFVAQPYYALADTASDTTKMINQQVLQTLPFDDRQDFDDAARGLLLKPKTLTIKDRNGRIVWDLETYRSFIDQEKSAPDTVNPSLWRNAQLNLHYGLFEVTDGIYQVRGYDLANITFIRGNKGWVVFDTGSTPETAKAAYALVSEKLGKFPVTAIMYSHSHVDHYGGVKGLVSEADVASAAVEIIAPQGFMEHAVAEGVIAGNAMTRRSTYMYGALLPRNAQGSVGAGLGMTNAFGPPSLIAPTMEISQTGERHIIDGIEMVFQMTPGAEAPAEMNIYLPQYRALWMAENTTRTMHNILTLRGALVRDPLIWSKYINETIQLYADKTDVRFQSHHWPQWGNADIVEDLKKQRDLYRFIHDRSVNMMNKGYVGEEIAEKIELPPELETYWGGRGYYGTLRHNARAVYQRYMGWYDGNPSSLNVLPPVEAARKYVDYMGGEEKALNRLREDINKGEYRWAAMALKHLVFANPENKEARVLLADSYRQMAYQAESGPWRSIYLQGAQELLNGLPQIKAGGSGSADTIKAMTPEMLFDYLAVRLNAEKAKGKKLGLNLYLTDLDETYYLELVHSVLNTTFTASKDAQVEVKLTKADLLSLLLQPDKAMPDNVVIKGDQAALKQFFGLFEAFDLWFEIVTPVQSEK